MTWRHRAVPDLAPAFRPRQLDGHLAGHLPGHAFPSLPRVLAEDAPTPRLYDCLPARAAPQGPWCEAPGRAQVLPGNDGKVPVNGGSGCRGWYAGPILGR